ncbi:RCC1 and BTB domain-containing protein 1-like isoform X2 [Dysidea avara]|uniref:RCC1 and BTB domain-containing protein 1-like isoform X2 n=1 Tax=Dysidea avara TaxID=196820 RepID=UPI00332E0550
MGTNCEKLNKWAILCVQDPLFLESVKIAYVFDNGNQAILVTRDDDVYTIGSNKYGCSGIDTSKCDVICGSQYFTTLRKVDSLCNKQLVSIASGFGPHVLAVTKSGKVYSWGYNANNELGHGTNTPNPNPIPTIITKLEQYQVKQVACGHYHSVALTNDGKVYSWGYNNHGEVGNGSTTTCETPYHNQLNGSTKCGTITCTRYSSFAVTETGQVFSWGFNGSGSLGIGSTIAELIPKNVTSLQNQVITKIIGGSYHVLALTKDGKLYSWGHNEYGQLGIGTTTCSTVPVQVGNHLGRFVDIAATISNDGAHSAACTSNESIYVWGRYLDKALCLPVLSSYKRLDDVFTTTSAPAAMWRPLVLESNVVEPKSATSSVMPPAKEYKIDYCHTLQKKVSLILMRKRIFFPKLKLQTKLKNCLVTSRVI